jgi:hypothetical protein
MIPNVDVKDMNVRIDTPELEHDLNLCAEFTYHESAIVVKLGVDVVECVNVLKPPGLHRRCLGMAFMMDIVGVHVHYGWWPSDRCRRLPLIG